MQQLEFFKVLNPCIGVCEANNKGYCKGCLRSREERLYWLKLNEPDKRHVVRLCQQRKARLSTAKQTVLSSADTVSDKLSQPYML